MPFLSVITINFNDASGLNKTIESVVNQSFKDIEYIIIDGGSKDGSVSVIEEYKDKISYWVSEPDKGIFNAMNKGIKAATGEYLLFLNSGDFLNGTDSLNDFIKHNDFQGDIIYGDYKFKEGEKIYPDYLTPLFFVRTSLPHQSTMFRREVFDKMGMYNEEYKIVSDRDFYIKCFLSNQFTFQHIRHSLTVFDLEGLSNNAQQEEKHKWEKEKMFQDHYGIYNEDYINMIGLQNQVNQLKKKTVSGIIKRIIIKIKKICHIR
ncbi:MAG: glycosyltransferase family 2 protein [Flavobacterium sp.]